MVVASLSLTEPAVGAVVVGATLATVVVAAMVVVVGLCVHCAYKSTFDANEYVAPFAYAVPVPFDSVFHPLNENPDLEKLFKVSAALVNPDWLAMVPVPPFGRNVTVEEVFCTAS
jgi:hypothetical protein